MRLTSITSRELILPDLQAERKVDALREMIAAIGRRHRWRLILMEGYLWEVQRRHNLNPGGLGGGVALVYAPITGLKAPTAALGLSRRGLDFQARDRQPAHVVLLMLGRPDPDAEELALLERVRAGLLAPGVARRFLGAPTPEDVWKMIEELDPIPVA